MRNIRLQIDAYSNRQKIVEGLANSGYPVWVESEALTLGTAYFVCIENLYGEEKQEGEDE